ncbi:MAG: TrkA C-terminal domain-containing protein [Nitrospiraceae bacterium]
MTTEFFRRIRKEFTLTARGIHETVLAIAERVNRKVQILKLHWQAASLCDQIEALHQTLGVTLCDLLARQTDSRTPEIGRETLEMHLADIASRIRLLKKELLQVDPQVRQIEFEALREDLLNLERDLFLRSATIERFRVVQGAPACGLPAGQLGMPPTVRVVALLRGPALLLSFDSTLFRAGDTVILLGQRDELKSILPLFLERKRATA